MKTILVPLWSSDDFSALHAAFDIAKQLKAHVQGCHVGPSVFELALGAVPKGPSARLAGHALASRLQQLRGAERSGATRARRYFHALCKREGVLIADTPRPADAVTAEWVDAEGEHFDSPFDQVRRRALYSDAVILQSRTDGSSIDFVGDLLLRTGRPVVVSAAGKAKKSIAERVLVAWKPTPEAARAVTAAMPLLRQAGKVTIGIATEDSTDSKAARQSASKLAANLAWHGVAAETRIAHKGSADAYERLISVAADLKADLLVMGAYGHSRTREMIFGGFTRKVLEHTPIATLLAH
jgi:nucleotide-binding universal stress UspA family protein